MMYFQHDGMQKSRHAQATFHFNPPHDGCYIVEEMHPMLMCEGSKNTKVHVHYSKVLQANGTVDQAANGGQWAFLGALQFYAGHHGKVTLSNEGTEPGTLTVFDQVRFTWSGKDCIEVDAHPRRAEIRINADFQNVARRLPEFGHALTTKLASLSNVPENSLRLIGLSSGSIIAEFLVLPNVVEDVLIPNHSALRNVGYLRDAINKNAAELCALALGSRRLDHKGGPLENCYVEFKDLGLAKPSVEAFEPVPLPTVPEQQLYTQTETQHVNLLQTVVDNVDSEAHDTTMEPLAKCPTTVLYAEKHHGMMYFQHDGMQKSRHAQATFHFNPPHDGCYIVEEMHPMLMCEGSKNTKVHIEYSEALQANGTVDQTANGGQWAFLGALQFYAGHHGKVMLSNEGTEPGTLTVFDQVRFTWSGKDCLEVDAHPRRVDIRINADFQNVAQRTYGFGRALMTKLAALAHVPENSLRLIGLRSGSIIAEFLVLPNVAEDVLIPTHSAQRNVGYLRDAVAKNAAELCALALGSRRLEHIGGPLENCYVEVKDLGFAKPSVEAFEPVPLHTVPEQQLQTQTETQHVNLLQTLVDDVDSEAHDTTMEPLAQCPLTVLHADFQHDGMQKNRRAQAIFHFDPPHDGCYIVEEMHPMLMCEGSKNTKVHVHYCKGLQANGTVDQAANGGQWAFLGALQFYAGHPGKVTLSNEGTEPGTLTVFDQVRFTWSGTDCMEVDAHPRRAEIRIKADFQNVAQRLHEFGRALTSKLAALAHVPENSLRLIGLRSGSIIA